MSSARQRFHSWLPAGAAALLALTTARAARAEDLSGSVDKAPELPVYEFGFRFKLPEIVIGKELDEAPSGLAADLGRRISPDWYVGALSSFDLYVSDQFGDHGTVTSRFQAGAEARYLLSRGHGSMRVNMGPVKRIPSLGWLSLSGGYETFGFVFGKASGAFANVGYLSELYVGDHFNLGMVYTVGATYDAPRVYGDGSLFHGTGSVAFRFAWGS